VGHRAGLDGRKIPSPPGFDPGPGIPYPVAIPTELPGPLVLEEGRSQNGLLFCFCFVSRRLQAGRGWTAWGSNTGGGQIFRTCPDRPWCPPSVLYNGYRVFFPASKRPGPGVDHPPPSSSEVKERVELFFCSPPLDLHGVCWGELHAVEGSSVS